jgi:hypothetical protein
MGVDIPTLAFQQSESLNRYIFCNLISLQLAT